jgi:hypothetical protein
VVAGALPLTGAQTTPATLVVRSARIGRHGVVTLSLDVFTPGTLGAVLDSGITLLQLGSSPTSPRAVQYVYATAAAKAVGRGIVTLALRPTSAGLIHRRRHHSLRLRLTIGFTPTGGHPLTSSQFVLLPPP